MGLLATRWSSEKSLIPGDFERFYVKLRVVFILFQYPPDSKLHPYLVNIHRTPTVCLAGCRVLGEASHSCCIAAPLPRTLSWRGGEVKRCDRSPRRAQMHSRTSQTNWVCGRALHPPWVPKKPRWKGWDAIFTDQIEKELSAAALSDVAAKSHTWLLMGRNVATILKAVSMWRWQWYKQMGRWVYRWSESFCNHFWRKMWQQLSKFKVHSLLDSAVPQRVI